VARPASSFPQDWCRINIFLPVGHDDELRAAEAIIAYLKQAYEGFTHSSLHPASFDGFWWDDKKGWVHDKIAMLIVDLDLSPQTTALNRKITLLQIKIHSEYKKKGCPQEEVWVSVHPIVMKRAKRSQASP